MTIRTLDALGVKFKRRRILENARRKFGIREKPLTALRLIDLHADLPYEVMRKREAGQRQVLEKRFLPLFRKGSVSTVISPFGFLQNTSQTG